MPTSIYSAIRLSQADLRDSLHFDVLTLIDCNEWVQFRHFKALTSQVVHGKYFEVGARSARKDGTCILQAACEMALSVRLPLQTSARRNFTSFCPLIRDEKLFLDRRSVTKSSNLAWERRTGNSSLLLRNK